LIDNGTASLGLDHLHRLVKLRPAVAFDRAEHVARKALRVDPHERRDLRTHLALDQHDKLLIARQGSITRDLKVAFFSRQVCCRDAFNCDSSSGGRAIWDRFIQSQVLHSRRYSTLRKGRIPYTSDYSAL